MAKNNKSKLDFPRTLFVVVGNPDSRDAFFDANKSIEDAHVSVEDQYPRDEPIEVGEYRLVRRMKTTRDVRVVHAVGVD